MPVSIFMAGDVYGQAYDRGVQTESNLYRLGRELRAADQQFVFDQQANPLRLDQLSETLRESRLKNTYDTATMQSRVDATAAQATILGAKAKFADVNAFYGAASNAQQVARNENMLTMDSISIAERRMDIADRYPVARANFEMGRAGLEASAPGVTAPAMPDLSQGERIGQQVLTGEGANRAIPREFQALYDQMFSRKDGGAVKMGVTADEGRVGMASAVAQLQDFDTGGPLYRSYVAQYGEQAAYAQRAMLRTTVAAAQDAAVVGEERRTADHQTTVAREQLDIKLLAKDREIEELKTQLARLQGGAQPAVAQPVAPVVAQPPAVEAPRQPDPLAQPAPNRADAGVTAQPGADAGDTEAPMPPAVPNYTLPRAQRGDAVLPGQITVLGGDGDEEVVLALPPMQISAGSEGGFVFPEAQDPPTVTGYSAGDDGVEIPTLTGNVSQVFRAMVQQESRGRQHDATGRTITSTAGAKGIAQVMPATAREQARRMGIPFDNNRYLNDADYNLKLGKGYFEFLVNRYDGNTTLATAAYNGGYGNVDKWIRKFGDPRTGRITDGQWASRIPITETRDYVRIVSRNAARARRSN